MIQKTKLWQIQKLRSKVQKIARALAMLSVENEIGSRLQTLSMGDHHEELHANCVRRCRIASNKRGIPECKPRRYIRLHIVPYLGLYV